MYNNVLHHTMTVNGENVGHAVLFSQVILTYKEEKIYFYIGLYDIIYNFTNFQDMATGNQTEVTSVPLNSVVWHDRRWQLIKTKMYVYQFSYG